MAKSWRVIWRVALAGLVLAALVSGGLILRQKARLGDFTKLDPQFKGSCRGVPGLARIGDMAVDRKARRIWAASAGQDGAKRGAIYLLPLDGFENASVRVDVSLGKPAAFSPVGISLWTGTDGQQVLYAVNRRAGALTRIEIYDVDKSGLLAHRSSVKAIKYPRIADVVGAGPNAFYVSVESVYPPGSWIEKLTALTRDRSGGLVYWISGKFKRVAADIEFAGSLATTPDGAALFATAVMGRELRIYDRDAASGKLSLREKVNLSAAPEKIDVAADGALWIATQPKLGALNAYALNPEGRTAPSQVLLVERDVSGQGGDVHQVYAANDGPMSGASIAIADSDRLILGGAYAPNAMACVLPQNFRQKAQHRFVAVR